MNQIDWDKIKFRASSWGNLLAEPVTKAAKDNGEVSKSCQMELIKIYNRVVYGRKKDITTKQMDKGILCEPESIKLFSMVEGKLFYKNDEPLENEWFTGHPDIFIGDNVENAIEIYDIKSSWELDTFSPKLIEEPDKGYVAQLNVYYSLTGAQGGGIAYCLVDCPFQVLESEKKRLLWAMDVISEESPEYKKAEAELTHLLTFPDIDYRERVTKQLVKRDDELIQRMKDKVPKLREWLQKYHNKRILHYPKQ
jgi:hypothetical protein